MALWNPRRPQRCLRDCPENLGRGKSSRGGLYPLFNLHSFTSICSTPRLKTAIFRIRHLVEREKEGRERERGREGGESKRA